MASHCRLEGHRNLDAHWLAPGRRLEHNASADGSLVKVSQGLADEGKSGSTGTVSRLAINVSAEERATKQAFEA
jgi:hypothetical protein